MTRSGRAARLAAGAALALLAASCGTAPPPRPPQPPPVRAAKPPRIEREPAIEVGLAWDLDSLIVESEGLELSAPTLIDFQGLSAMKLKRTAEGMSLGDPADEEPPIPVRDTLWATPRRGELRWNGKRWRGAFKVFVGPRGKLTLATRLPLEAYLLGVVPLEIGGLKDELLEAGRAQAIAARSYTLFYKGRRASEGFDLYGTVEDQVYGPVESERPLATKCVETTRGQVALHQGQPIRANYCSTCGGMTAAVWEAWPAPPLPYLASRRDAGGGADFCAASPQYRWRERWSAGEFLADVARFAPAQGLRLPPAGPGALIDVRAETRSLSGRVWRLRVRTTTMDLAIPAYAIRGTLRRPGLPGSILRSDLFKIDVRRDPASGRALEVIVSGAGSGHGVGLCQTGALGMARSGLRAERILGHYYPGTEVRRLY